MFDFANPWVLLLWPLPGLIRWLLPAAQMQAQRALRIPFFQFLAAGQRQQPGIKKIRAWQWILVVLLWTLFLIALARPQTLGEPIQQTRAGRNIMLAIDISQSMALTDLDWQGREVSRLQVVKAVAGEFIDQRAGDRLGLILFGSQAYLQTPLTFDRKTVKSQLIDATIGLAGKQTAIGDALALSIKHLQHTPESQRIVVLLTDGVSNVGIDPLTAVATAIKEKVKIYPIAFGNDTVMIDTFLGPRKVNLPLDEKMLAMIAEKTGGQYFRAKDSKALKKVYQTLNKIEKITIDAQVFRPIQEWYPYPLAGMVILILFAVFMHIMKMLLQLPFLGLGQYRLKLKSTQEGCSVSEVQ